MILGSHNIHETRNSKEGFFHINLSLSLRICDHFHDEMHKEMAKAMKNMESWHKNWEISYAHDLIVVRRKYELTK